MDKNNGTTHPEYPIRSREFSGLIEKVTSVMRRYQKTLTKGGISPRPELLADGYRWSSHALCITLKESDGYHGGDFISISEQRLIEPSTDEQRYASLGIITYESGKGTPYSGNGMLYAYAIFSLNGNDLDKKTASVYELPKEKKLITIANDFDTDKPPITIDYFLSKVYNSRDALTLEEIRPKLNKTAYLLSRGRRRIGHLN